MKLAVQQTLVPGDSLITKFKNAAAFGFDGIELAVWGLSGPFHTHRDEIVEAMDASGLMVSSICPSGDDDFVHPDPTERQRRLEGLVRMLEFAALIDAAGVIALPIRRPVHLLDLSPVATEDALITKIAVATLRLVLDRVDEVTVPIFLEPLNRYEAYYLKTLSDAVALCEQVGDPRVRVMADLFHMSIEEVGLPEALTKAGSHLGHVHLADSNRLLPGKGHTDFISVFSALQAIGFDGWMALECGVPGDASKVLSETVSFLRDIWERART